MADIASQDDRPRQERSPSFPFISLKRALVRLEALATQHKRNPARLSVVAESWGYGTKSSGLLQSVAALKQYGLIDDMGSGEDRKIQPSDLGWRILHDTRPGVREQAIRDAAMRPRIMAELVPVWVPRRPSDSHCISDLHLDRGFTVEAARAFLKIFDETVSFANLPSDDSPSNTEHGAEVSQATETVGETVAPRQTAVAIHPPKVLAAPPREAPPDALVRPERLAGPRYTFHLPEGMVLLELPPMALTPESVEELEGWLAVMMRRARRGMTLKSSELPPSDD